MFFIFIFILFFILLPVCFFIPCLRFAYRLLTVCYRFASRLLIRFSAFAACFCLLPACVQIRLCHNERKGGRIGKLTEVRLNAVKRIAHDRVVSIAAGLFVLDSGDSFKETPIECKLFSRRVSNPMRCSP